MKETEMMERKKVTFGILAHVDAGKTTLAESMLFQTGSIRSAGRVDHGDAFLDTHALEKERGITIFSKQAIMMVDDLEITLLDTPGHVDFSAEMERTLQVLDYAILVISGADGVQGHVLTLWQLLDRYSVPVFLFINKMDQDGTDREALLGELRSRLSSNCLPFDGRAPGKGTEPLDDGLQEEAALCDEALMESYLSGREVCLNDAAVLVKERLLFPCFFGSALKMTGVDSFLEWIRALTILPSRPDVFSASVFKIAREGSTRLTYLKVTGGTLKVRQLFPEWDEKVDQIRIYSGAGYTTAARADAGTVCAVTGLHHTKAGMELGKQTGQIKPVLEPVLTYALLLPEKEDVHLAFQKLKQLEEEIPELNLAWNAKTGQILAQVMGEVQIEILQKLIQSRFEMEVSFGEGQIVYKETISDVTEGVGHFEPLRHYAEVHLILEPGERGSGFTADTACSSDSLDLNWQRLILTHLYERIHPGILTGSELTDVRVTLAAGKAHLKHTEGGDFRQATYRAVRQGLWKARNVLLEPVYAFRLEVPQAAIGRAMTDLQAMHGTFDPPVTEGDFAVLTGTCPVACMRGYTKQVRIYTGGAGRLYCSLSGYEVCHNQEEVCQAIGYDADADMENPCGSVFCSHGAGVTVPWDQVEAHMHLEAQLPGWLNRKNRNGAEDAAGCLPEEKTEEKASYGTGPLSFADDEELMAIFERTYGAIRQERSTWKKSRSFGSQHRGETSGSSQKSGREKEKILLVDGYNIIYSWDEFKDLVTDNMDGARLKLMEILSNYQGYTRIPVLLVFDAYKVEGGEEKTFRHHNIYVVYTKEAETADSYIERTVHVLASRYDVTVATSDATEQIIIWGQGARRLSARELKEEIAAACLEMQERFLKKNPDGKRYLFDDLPNDMEAFMEEVRLGIRSLGEGLG